MPTIAEVKRGRIANKFLEIGKHRFFKRAPVWLYPQQAENQYNRFLLSIAAAMNTATHGHIIKYLPDLVEEAGTVSRTDSFPDAVDRLMENLRLEVNSKIVGQEAMLIDVGQKVNQWNDKQWQKTMRKVLGIQLFSREPWLIDQLDSFIKENTTLITNLKEQTYKDIEGIVQRGIRSGKRIKTITQELTNKTSIPGLPVGPLKKVKNRARLIARDQVSKLNGSITRLRQTGVGITDYFWRTALDERVRPSHREKEGNRYSWDKSPTDTGHPGEDYQCRCWAEGDFSSMFNEVSLLNE